MDVVDGNCIGKRKHSKDNEKNGKSIQHKMTNIEREQQNSQLNSFHYSMDYKYRGEVLIFNHETFCFKNLAHPDDNPPPRIGTEVDCNTIKSTMKFLGFNCTVYQDLKYEDMKDALKRAANDDHSDRDCFVVFVLTHGELGCLFASDKIYKSEELWSPFVEENCLSLKGKPKLFFIQACQGSRLDAGITMKSDARGKVKRLSSIPDGKPILDEDMYVPHRFNTKPDFLICNSTAPGYYAWRNINFGSWFMQTLCTELRKNAYTNQLLHILTTVNLYISVNKESAHPDPEMDRKRQVICISSNLTKLLLFTKKN